MMVERRYQIEDFQIVRVIGRGYMGKVLVVQDRSTGQVYAIKSIHKQAILERRELQHTRSERDILAELGAHHPANNSHNGTSRCPFLIKLHAAFQDRANIYFLLDFHSGGDLAGLLAQRIKIPESWARLYAAEIVVGLSVLHERGIIYRDLKPENILIAHNGHLVLTDFGLSKLLRPLPDDNGGTRTLCGTPEYLAPEILLRRTYDFAVDWWSLGILLYEMLIGMTPFWADTPIQMYANIVAQVDPEFPLTISWAARDLISQLLRRNPSSRPDSNQIKTHSFFASIDWNALVRMEYPPPFVPHLSSPTDFTAFEETFTSMPPIITPDETGSLSMSPNAQKAFQNFSFRPSQFQ